MPFSGEQREIVWKVDAVQITAVIRDKPFDREIDFAKQDSWVAPSRVMRLKSAPLLQFLEPGALPGYSSGHSAPAIG